MDNHVFRPLFVLASLVLVVLIVRALVVPRDFGVGANGYMYSWHRKSSEAEWKAREPRYRGADYCKDCHADRHQEVHQSTHARISCENCHGPARDHPEDPPKLTINRDRALCLRCHYALPYANSARARIKGIDPAEHNPGVECATCHDPHRPNPGGVR